MNVSTQKIQNEITSLKAELEASPFTRVETYIASQVMNDMMSDLTSFFKDDEKSAFVDSMFERVHFHNLERKIKDYQETISSDLMYCPKRYVVTNTKSLNSPAGFHSSDKVFTQTKIAIHTDSLKGIPSCNVELFAHDVDKIASC